MGGEKNIPLLAENLEPGSPTILIGAACEALGLLWSKDSENWAVPAGLLSRLAQIAAGHGENAILAAFAISRLKGEAPFIPEEDFIKADSQAQNSFA